MLYKSIIILIAATIIVSSSATDDRPRGSSVRTVLSTRFDPIGERPSTPPISVPPRTANFYLNYAREQLNGLPAEEPALDFAPLSSDSETTPPPSPTSNTTIRMQLYSYARTLTENAQEQGSYNPNTVSQQLSEEERIVNTARRLLDNPSGMPAFMALALNPMSSFDNFTSRNAPNTELKRQYPRGRSEEASLN